MQKGVRAANRHEGDERLECLKCNKIIYPHWDAAARIALHMQDTRGSEVRPYMGHKCGWFHVGKRGKKTVRS